MEPGHPKSILRDFMGCQEHVEPRSRWPDVARPPFNPNGGAEPEADGDSKEENAGDKDEGSRVVVQMEEVVRTVNVVMVLVP